MTSALAEALSILTTGGEAARRAQLDANVLTALSTAPSAQLWASLMEAIEAVGRDGGGAFEVAKVAAALTEAVSAVVSAQLTSLIGL